MKEHKDLVFACSSLAGYARPFPFDDRAWYDLRGLFSFDFLIYKRERASNALKRSPRVRVLSRRERVVLAWTSPSEPLLNALKRSPRASDIFVKESKGLSLPSRVVQSCGQVGRRLGLVQSS
jgi:hypothetical protein